MHVTTGFGLCVRKNLPVVEGDLNLCVFAVEVMLQPVKIASAFPLAHWEVVKQIVAAGFWLCGRHLRLGENPLEALDGETAHILNGI